MPIAISNAANNGHYTTDNTFFSWSFDAGGHPLLVVARGEYPSGFGDDITGITYGGVAMTLLGKVAVAGCRWTYLFGLLNPASGFNDVVVSAANEHFMFGCAVSYSGVTSFGQVVTATQGSANETFAIGMTTQYANSWVTAAIGSEEANFFAGSGTTLRSRMSLFLDPGFVDNNAAVAASTPVTLNVFTTGANLWAGVAVELIAAVSSLNATPAESIKVFDSVGVTRFSPNLIELTAPVQSLKVKDTLSAVIPGFTTTKTVGPGKDYTTLQAAVNAAQDGWELVLTSGVTFNEAVVFPATPHVTPVIIRSSTAAPDRRVALSDAADMATIAGSQYDEPTFAGVGIKGWHFKFIRFYRNTPTVNPAIYFENAVLGGGTFRNTDNITIERCLIEGGPNGANANGIYFSGSNYVIDRNYISNIRYLGRESHGLVSHDGPGPWRITDNYNESASINSLIGGWTCSSPAHTPNDILFENNTYYKRPEWSNVGYGVKNLFELKHATNVIVRGNTFENNWNDGQDGHGILFQATNDAGDSPWTKITDVLFENNIMRGSDRGINLNGHDAMAGHDSQGMARITFRNNLLQTTGARILTLTAEVDGLTIEHNTFKNANEEYGVFAILYTGNIAIPGNTTRTANYAVKDYIFRNNLLYHAWGHEGEYGLKGTAGLDAHVYNGTYTFSHNVMADGPDGMTYPTATNQFPSIPTFESNFVDLVNFQLTGGSAYRNAGSDGKDLGWTGTGSGNLSVIMPVQSIRILDSLTVVRSSPATIELGVTIERARVADTLTVARVALGTLTTFVNPEVMKASDVVTALRTTNLSIAAPANALKVRDILTALRVTVTSPPVIATGTLPNGTVGTAYNQSIVVNNGTQPFLFEVTSGSLPPGLTLDPATGVVSGTPTSIGTWNFTISVTDSFP